MSRSLDWVGIFGIGSSESNALSKRTRASKGLFMSASADSCFFVYIVRCADDSFYVGNTADVGKRTNVHNGGRGALWKQ